ncbi:hypothetical protein PFISCL1PPCAC_22008, partial [Pristionchus fissidentatus]
EMEGIVQALREELGKTVNKKHEVMSSVLQAKDNIAANFTRIIAQAVSRCLDVMAQTEKIGITHIENLDSRIARINRTIKMAENKKEIAARSTTAPNFATRLCVQKAVIAMIPQVYAEYEQLQNRTLSADIPVLKLSFSHVVLNHIANLGKGIMTNLIDGSCQQVQVATLTISIVKPMRLSKLLNAKHFTKFHEVRIQKKTESFEGNRMHSDPGFNYIGIVAATLVVPP